MKSINLINLLIYQGYFRALYFCAIFFSAICFNLIFHFYEKGQIAQVLASSFMTFVFYMAADAADILCEIFSDKIKGYKVTLKS